MPDKIILLVEDSPSDAALTKRAFAKQHIANHVVVAEDGQEALDYLFGTEQHEPSNPLPAIVLLDLNLPKVGGLDVLQRIRSDERTKWMPVVILTTSKEERDLIAGYSLGVNSYVRKPIDFGQFSEAVRNLGLYWLVINQPPPESTPL